MAAVLIVEDERIVAKDIEKSLIAMQHEVLGSVASSDEALRRASERCPDLVLMDIHIKGKLDGIETAAILRSRFQVPVVYLTAFADAETVTRATFTEPFGYILKPYNANELRSIVEIALYKHRMEMRLRDNEESLKTTLNSIADAVVATDSERRVKRMNPAAEALTGWTLGDAQDRLIEEVMCLRSAHSGLTIESPVAQALSGAVVTGLPSDTLLVARDGTVRPIADSAAPLRDAKGVVRGSVVVFADVSDRRKLEAQVAAAGRMAAVGTLAAGVAHEINNPLTAVFLGLDLACTWLPESSACLRSAEGAMSADALSVWEETGASATLERLDALGDVLRDARRGADRVRDIVRDLKTFSRAEDTPALSLVSLNAVVGSAVSLCMNEIRHRAELVEDYGDVPPVEASESRLGQVFVNLLVNAAQAIPDGDATHHRIRVATYTATDGSAVVEVEDTGAGIPLELRTRIFDPFFTTKGVGVGTGLGLSISLNIVRSFHGELQVESEPGAGSTFRVLLPKAQAQSVGLSPEGAPFVTRTLKGGRPRILFIDDEVAIGRVVRLALAPHHEVVAVPSARAGLSLIRDGVSFDAVACDLMMPDMTGMEFHAELLTIAPLLAPRVVFVTGGAFSARARAFIDSVPNPRLEKPFQPEELDAILMQLLANESPPN